MEYINKLNRILEKWKNHFVKYTEDGIMKKEFIDTPAFRYYQIENITECFYQKIGDYHSSTIMHISSFI